VQVDDVELGNPLRSLLVDELRFPIADEGTVFNTEEERTLILRGEQEALLLRVFVHEPLLKCATMQPAGMA